MTEIDVDAILEAEPDGRRDNLSPSMVLARLTDAADLLRTGLSNTGGYDLMKATPAQKQEIVDFRDMLLEWKEPMTLWLNRIDEMWRLLGEKTGAREFPLGDGRVVAIEDPANTYSTQEQQLRSRLMELVRDGLLSKEDVDAAIQPVTSFKLNHTELNKLARKRGDLVKAAIDQFRTRVQSAGRATVRYPRRVK